jgi:hypothetical protein
MFKNDEVSEVGVLNANAAVTALSANDTLSIPNGPSTFTDWIYDAVSAVPPSPPPPFMITNIPSEPEEITSTPLPLKFILAVSVCTNDDV